MKNYTVLIIAIATVILNSCSPAQKESKTEAVLSPNQVQSAIVSPDSLVTEAVPAAAVVPVKQPTVNKTTTPPELNPPHGQPFHRCDIPVGSPLNSAPAKPAATTKPAQVVNRTGTAPTLENAAKLNNPQTNNSMAPTVSNSVPPKLNPPHGQPFHRCDIAVGSPLPQN